MAARQTTPKKSPLKRKSGRKVRVRSVVSNQIARFVQHKQDEFSFSNFAMVHNFTLLQSTPIPTSRSMKAVVDRRRKSAPVPEVDEVEVVSPVKKLKLSSPKAKKSPAKSPKPSKSPGKG